MQPRPSHFRSLFVLPLLALVLAACPRDGTGPVLLTPEQVAGTYEVCSLVFTPNNALFPAVDVRAHAIDTRPEAPLRAGLLLRINRTFELRFTSPDDEIHSLGGSFQLGASAVSLTFSAGTAATARTTLLLPNRLDLEFEDTPRQQLSTSQATTSALRADYAHLAQVSESGLDTEIPGTISARFAVGSCE